MPALRAVALLGFLLGTVLLTYGILVDRLLIAVAAVAVWGVGVAVGIFAQKLNVKAR